MGVPALFTFGAGPDAKDSTKTIANFRQGGLSLPDRSYYLKTDAKSVETRQRFVAHMANMFKLAGDTPEAAAKKARLVLDFETALAQGIRSTAWPCATPTAPITSSSLKEFQALTPDFDWNAIFQADWTPRRLQTLNVSQPILRQRALLAELPNTTMDYFKAYFEYHLLRAHAEQLPAAFENESIRLLAALSDRRQEQRPRQYRCVRVVDRELGDLLGQKYIRADLRRRCQSADHAVGDGSRKGAGGRTFNRSTG